MEKSSHFRWPLTWSSVTILICNEGSKFLKNQIKWETVMSVQSEKEV